ncbi:MAG: triose-phosphate isomerase [Candidatus Neomarinimicrobiota bacterium]|nr:triose-phosphate isomerase [Candidatus Neomarinimicrobiota bacterium]MEC9455618.1 triose-phosphate isomerase [Candidatus Neomarinimicrobiota bacterium]MED5451478.1 triose-phosphate isomerase [Candidatus Neomarinimicrobiota bacterium]MEE3301933.1 triose-phosphate isomerase [Candidatus Neomarinimicrobiota bacterium]
MKKTILAANWKMYLNENESVDFIKRMNQEEGSFSNSNVIIFPSHTCINQVQKNLTSNNIKVGMQDCDIHTSGAYTGSVSINSITTVDYCIVGHSERRLIYNDSDSIVQNKLQTIFNHNVSAILCVGETKEEKDNNQTHSVIDKQLSILPEDLKNNLIIAYEPVWSIGSGDLPSNEYIEEVLSYIKNKLKSLYSDEIAEEVILLYGGSVDEDSVNRLLKVKLIDGFLIGSASANFEAFKAIAEKIKL